jgi:tetratricopeptide (TPR) repeat protein
MADRRFRMPIEAVLVPLLLLAVWGTHQVNRELEVGRIEDVSDGRVGVLPDGNVVRVISLGFERLIADLFWIRTVYYIGDEHAMNAGWPDAERLAHLVVDTDPGFDSAYVVMGSVLNGLRTDPDAAIRLLEKGAAISSYWRIHFLLGFQYFMEKADYARGAESLQRAFALGGPEYLQFLISRLYASSGDPETAMQFIAARLQQEETPQIRERLQQRYADLWIVRDLRLIDAAIEKFRADRGRDPAGVPELVEAGLLTAEPRDPRNNAYRIEGGRARSALEHEPLEINMPRERKS